MRLHVLGSGTALPTKTRGASGYACEAADGSVLVLECGPGSTRRWPHHGIEFARVLGIAITHHHVDHCSDLAAVLFARNVFEPPLATPLTLIGPVGHVALVDGLRSLYGRGVADAEGTQSIVELRDRESCVVGPFRVEAREVKHVGGALGYRIEADGVTLVFSGDSGECDELDALCVGADLALLECSYPASRPTTRHLNTQGAAATAMRAALARVVLTHFYPACDDIDVAAEVRAAGYQGALELARDGLVLEI